MAGRSSSATSAGEAPRPDSPKQTKQMKIIATLDTADFRDCVNTGYTFVLYSDGHLSAEYHSRWQGSRDGARYVTRPGEVDLSKLDPADPDRDAEACLTAAVQDVHPSEDAHWHQVRRGRLVQ
ncbi:MAG: hypothetical protein KGL39_52140 [Patescibacteria group bacterium]|nr:hypothetical protein [Patescibacteria group bacterium]